MSVFNAVLLPAPPSVLLPVLQAKAKRGPPRQAKYAIHCINAMFTNRDTHFAQIFEVSHVLHTSEMLQKSYISVFYTLQKLCLLYAIDLDILMNVPQIY